MSGGGLVGVSGVSVSGTGWAVSSDGCTYMIMESSSFAPIRGCSVGVSVHPTSRGTSSGTLIVHTTDGDVTAHLHALAAGPSIASFTPGSGTAGTTVTVNGSGFTGASAVTIGGVAAESFTVNSDSQITAVVATGSRTGAVTVTTPTGTATSARSFVLILSQPPVVNVFSPSQGLVGASVTIRGSHLTGATAVLFNGTPATSFSVVSDGVITAFVPVGATTGRVAVVTAGGTATSAGPFTVIPAVAAAPVILGFSPSAGIRGVRVVISGSGFTGATSVKFNGKPASFSVLSDGTISAVVPLGATTGHITVTTAGGTATSAAVFTI